MTLSNHAAVLLGKKAVKGRRGGQIFFILKIFGRGDRFNLRKEECFCGDRNKTSAHYSRPPTVRGPVLYCIVLSAKPRQLERLKVVKRTSVSQI